MVDAAREGTQMASDDLIGYMLSQRVRKRRWPYPAANPGATPTPKRLPPNAPSGNAVTP